MAGVKGRSGGARPGSGPKPKPAVDAALIDSAAEFLLQVMQGKLKPSVDQMTAAKALLSASAAGKKEAKQEAAKSAGAGKFGPSGAPLTLVKTA